MNALEINRHKEIASNHAILLITTSENLRTSLQKAFVNSNYDLVTAANERTALEVVTSRKPVVILVDRDTYQWQRLRKHEIVKRVWVVTLQTTHNDSEQEACISELDEGLDACWCDQTHRQIVARVRSFLRRHLSTSSQPTAFQVGELRMDIARHEVHIGERPVELTPREFKILKQFMESPGLVLDRQELLNRVWGADYALEEHALDVHIHSLRQKIEPEPSKPVFLLTIRGVGYKLQPMQDETTQTR